MKVEIVRDLIGGRWLAKVTVPGARPLNLVPKEEDGVESQGDLLRWVGDMDDAIRDDESDHGGIADMLREHAGGGS